MQPPRSAPWSRAALAAAVALSACAEAPAAIPAEVAVATAAATASFVRTAVDSRGRPRFQIDGRVTQLIGGNMTELPWLGATEQDKELAWAQGVGFKVVRVWGVDDGTGASAMATRLRGVLDRAAAHGLHVIVALTHNYHQPNWLNGSSTYHAVPGDARPNAFVSDANGFYTRDCGAPVRWCLDDRWIDWGYGAYYQGYATSLVRLLADHPAVFAWDIANETSGSSRQAWIVERVTAFYETLASKIKAADPNHLVTTGLISTSWVGMTDAQRDRVYGSANVDFLTVHEYEEPFNSEAQTDEVWRARNRYHKPVIVEELGVHSTASATSYYNNRLRSADPAFEATGIVYWGVASTAHPELADKTWSPRALGAETWFTQFWQQWAQTLNLASEGPPCVALAAGAGLGVNQGVQSCDRAYTLVFQGDGNLVLYGPSGAVWASCSQDAAPTGAFMQTDGNLVVYASAGAKWNSHTAGHAGARLWFEGGAVVMRAPDGSALWSSRTWCQ